MSKNGMSRRALLRNGAGVLVGTAVGAPMVHAQGTGGTLKCGFWDHWVPAGNGAMRELCQEWGEKNRVNVQVDFITSVGNQNLLTINAQAQSKSGHDILSFPTWEPSAKYDLLEPVDDVMGRLTQKYGPVNDAATYLGKAGGKWVAIPAVSGTQFKTSCTRFDLMQQHAGIDIRAMWPASNTMGPGADTWNWDTFLTAAEKCHKAGNPFGLPMGQFSDAVDWVGACMNSFGAHVMDAEGKVTVRNNAKLRTAVEYLVRLSRFLPDDVWAWDDASNNRSLISGRASLIFNPPSAWAVAKRDAPQVAEKCWYAPSPAGSEGRYTPYLPYFWGIWNFSSNKTSAKALLEFLSERSSAEKMTTASSGYDIPPFLSMADFKIWETEGPPTGTLFNYPLKPHQHGIASVAFAPAPAEFAVQAYQQGLNTKLIARISQGGSSVDSALSWIEDELTTIVRGG